MNKNPLFSVLIAQYNNGKYLPTAVESVRMQTYTNWEIIIVDDVSTDNSKDVYDLYKDDPKIKIYYNEKNGGCGYTKKRLLDLSNGEICGFLDPDDAFALPETLSLMVNKHLLNDDVSLVYSKLIYCDENLNQKGSNIWSTEHIKPDYLHTNINVTHFSSFKKKLYNLTEGNNPEFRLADDQDLYYKLEEVGKFDYIDKALYLYRGHPGAISNNIYKTIFWHLKAVDLACKRRNIPKDAEEIAEKLMIDYITAPYLNQISRPSVRFFLKVLKNFIRRLFVHK